MNWVAGLLGGACLLVGVLLGLLISARRKRDRQVDQLIPLQQRPAVVVPEGTSQVLAVAEQIGEHLSRFLVVVDKSTVPVGTADMVRRLIGEELKKRGESIDFEVVSNPEFLKEGDAVNDFMKPDRVIVGTDSLKAAEMMHELYAPFARSRALGALILVDTASQRTAGAGLVR